jgi:hypothetical protein
MSERETHFFDVGDQFFRFFFLAAVRDHCNFGPTFPPYEFFIRKRFSRQKVSAATSKYLAVKFDARVADRGVRGSPEHAREVSASLVTSAVS